MSIVTRAKYNLFSARTPKDLLLNTAVWRDDGTQECGVQGSECHPLFDTPRPRRLEHGALNTGHTAAVFLCGLAVAQFPRLDGADRRLHLGPLLGIVGNLAAADRLALVLGAVHPRFDAFANRFQFKLRQAGQELEEQPTEGRRGIKAFLGAQESDGQRIPYRQRVMQVLDRPKGAVQLKHHHRIEPVLNRIVLELSPGGAVEQVVGAGLVDVGLGNVPVGVLADKLP